ncbi:MAG: hypothetical protein H0X38_07490, partial [Planctomycetes bacterium]|nr:hypothetical protein [Planctomycetota bacterium]
LGAVAGRWPEALTVLVQATGDAPAQAAALLEYGPPPGAPLPVAQAWIDLARKSPAGAERIGMLTHAELLLERALPALNGADAKRAHAALDQILPQIPLDPARINWTTLTAAEWERIPAPIYPLTARVDRSDSGLVLEPGESVRVVPHPTETWSFLVEVKDHVVCTWKGVERSVSLELNDGNTITHITHRLGSQGYLYGSVLMWFDVNQKKQVGVINGPGRLWFGPSTDRTVEGSTNGTIRLKIVRLDGE